MEADSHYNGGKRQVGDIIADKTAAEQIGQYLYRFYKDIIKSALPDLPWQVVHNIEEKGACNPISRQAEGI